LPNPVCYYTLSDITGGLALQFPTVIVKQALRGFPHIAHKLGFIEPNRPLYVKVFTLPKIRKRSRVFGGHLY